MPTAIAEKPTKTNEAPAEVAPSPNVTIDPPDPEQVAAACKEILSVLTLEWMDSAAVGAALEQIDSDLPTLAYSAAIMQLVANGEVLSYQGESYRHFKRPTQTAPTSASHVFSGGGNELFREIQRIYKRNTGKDLQPSYIRGREESWEAEQRAAGKLLVLEEAGAPEDQWSRLRAEARQWLIDHGKGRSYLAIQIKAAQIWREERDGRKAAVADRQPEREMERVGVGG